MDTTTFDDTTTEDAVVTSSPRPAPLTPRSVSAVKKPLVNITPPLRRVIQSEAASVVGKSFPTASTSSKTSDQTKLRKAPAFLDYLELLPNVTNPNEDVCNVKKTLEKMINLLSVETEITGPKITPLEENDVEVAEEEEEEVEEGDMSQLVVAAVAKQKKKKSKKFCPKSLMWTCCVADSLITVKKNRRNTVSECKCRYCGEKFTGATIFHHLEVVHNIFKEKIEKGLQLE